MRVEKRLRKTRKIITVRGEIINENFYVTSGKVLLGKIYFQRNLVDWWLSGSRMMEENLESEKPSRRIMEKPIEQNNLSRILLLMYV